MFFASRGRRGRVEPSGTLSKPAKLSGAKKLCRRPGAVEKLDVRLTRVDLEHESNLSAGE